MSKTPLVAALAALLVSACAGVESPARPDVATTTDATTATSIDAPEPRAAATPAGEAQRLRALVEEYFEEYLRLNPLLATSIGDPRYNDRFVVDISPQGKADAEKLQRDYLARIQSIDASALSGQDRLSHEIFRSARERDLEGFRFPRELLPLNQFFSTTNTFVQLGSGDGIQPFKTVQDYDNFLKRLDGLVAWVDQAISNMRIGMQRGYVLPRILAERTLPQLQAQVVSKAEDSLFWGSIRKLPADFSAADRERLTAAYKNAIETKVVPAYRKLHDFMQAEYLPQTRASAGLGALPDGPAWYAYNVREITTTNYSPEEIHAIGLAEVKRIHAEMAQVMQRVGFKGTLSEFFTHLNSDPQFFFPSREALVAGYVATKQRVDPQLPKLFETLPGADYEVRAD